MNRLLRRTILLIVISAMAALCLLPEAYAIDATTAPTGLTAIAQSDKALNSGLGKIIFYWTDSSTNEAGFVVHQAPPPGTTYAAVTGSPIASTTTGTTGTQYSYTADSLTDNTLYTYRVVAYVSDATGDTGAWVYTSNTTLDRTAPTTPGAPSTTTPTNNTTPAWTWTASTDAHSGLRTSNTYIVYWDTAAGGTTNSAYSNTNSYTHTVALAQNTWYSKIIAYDNQNNYSAASGNGSVLIDTVAPTAAITYSPNRAVKSGEVLTITATFSESMADSPVPQIAISGSNTVAATNMTKSSATVYTYSHTVAAGNGASTVALSAGTDIATNVITSAPTSGATFTVDNTAPVINNIKVTSSKTDYFSPKSPGNLGATGGTVYFNSVAGQGEWQNLTIEVDDVTETYPASLQGATAFNDSPALDTSAPWQQVYSVDQAIGSQLGVVFTFKDTAANTDTATINFTVDNTAPSPGSLSWTASGNVVSSLGNNKTYISGSTIYYASHASGETTTVTLQIAGASDATSGLYKYQFPAVFGATSPDALKYHPTVTCSYTIDSADIGAGSSSAATYDSVNNSASTNSITIVRDLTVDNNVTSATETHGVQSGVVQSSVSDPAFTWTAPADNDSGVAGYYWYFGTDSAGTPDQWTTAANCDPAAVTTYHRYYLRIKTKDNVGNVSAPATVFTFIYIPSCPPTAAKSASTWYQGNIGVETFGFSQADCGVKFTKFYYKWDRNASYSVTTGDTSDWTTASSKNLVPYNSNKIYLHARPANSSDDLGPQSDLGPFYFVDTGRLLKHKKFFDDDGALISTTP